MNKYHDYHNYCLLTESTIHITNCQLNGKSNDISLNFYKKLSVIIMIITRFQLSPVKEKYTMSIIANKIITIIAIIE